MTEEERIEIRRKRKREDRRLERRRSKPIVRHVQRFASTEGPMNLDKCRVCRKTITLDTDPRTTKLVLLNLDGSLHRHQDG